MISFWCVGQSFRTILHVMPIQKTGYLMKINFVELPTELPETHSKNMMPMIYVHLSNFWKKCWSKRPV